MKKLISWITIGVILGCAVLGYYAPRSFLQIAFAQQNTDRDNNADYLQIGFALMQEKLGILSIGLSDHDTLKALGSPEKKSTAQIWGADGMEHQRWYYPAKGIELDMIRKESRQSIHTISIKSFCDYQTQRGIKIGSSDIDVQRAYKNELNPRDSNPNATLVAGTVYGGIVFGLKDNIVTSIFIGAAAE